MAAILSPPVVVGTWRAGQGMRVAVVGPDRQTRALVARALALVAGLTLIPARAALPAPTRPGIRDRWLSLAVTRLAQRMAREDLAQGGCVSDGSVFEDWLSGAHGRARRSPIHCAAAARWRGLGLLHCAAAQGIATRYDHWVVVSPRPRANDVGAAARARCQQRALDHLIAQHALPARVVVGDAAHQLSQILSDTGLRPRMPIAKAVEQASR